jgi:hypothetical protein
MMLFDRESGLDSMPRLAEDARHAAAAHVREKIRLETPPEKVKIVSRYRPLAPANV